MNSKHATPEDFSRWTEKAAAMTVEALVWSANDAREAQRATDRTDPGLSGRYADEAATYEQELASRRRAAVQP
jgi:hypothetical protein